MILYGFSMYIISIGPYVTCTNVLWIFLCYMQRLIFWVIIHVVTSQDNELGVTLLNRSVKRIFDENLFTEYTAIAEYGIVW